MDSCYRFDTIGPDAPADDPRRHQYYCALGLGFLEKDNTPEETAKQTEFAIADKAVMHGVYVEGIEMPIATFTDVPKPINVGHGRLLPANLISDVTVRASHRRRGILTEMMTRSLAEAKERGEVFAALTASEAVIYGRFGFGISLRLAAGEINATKFRLRTQPVGQCEYITREEAVEHSARITEQMLRADRGSMGRFAFQASMIAGTYDWHTGSADRAVRAVAHRIDGEIAGLAFYKPVPDSDPGEITVTEIQTTDPRSYVALWQFLASIDLVDKLSSRRFRVDDPLRWAMTDFRAFKETKVYDMIWLRILDPMRALSERGWDATGELVLRIDDPMGFADGTFRIVADGDRAEVTRVNDKPQATITADVLASLYFGDVSARTLAQAGRIEGDADAIDALFATKDAAYMPVGF